MEALFFFNVCCKLALKQRNQKVFHQNTLLQTQTHNRNDNDKVKKFVVNIFNNFMEQIII